MKSTNLILLVLVILLFWNCTEKKTQEIGNQKIFQHFQKEEQKFTLTSNEQETIIGKEGTKITIDINSLKLINGNQIQTDIEVSLIEYYKTSDIILANLSTSSNGKLIETGGMINLKATSNGQEVILKKGKQIEIEFASQKQKGMKTFHGKHEMGLINWNPEKKSLKTEKAGFFAQVDTSEQMYEEASYVSDSTFRNNILFSSKFGWINCDRFLEFENLTTLRIDYDTIYNPTAYLVFEDINSIMPCYHMKDHLQFINLPLDYKVNLIAFCAKNEKTYFYSKKISISEFPIPEIEFKEVPMDRIKKEIEMILE